MALLCYRTLVSKISQMCLERVHHIMKKIQIMDRISRQLLYKKTKRLVQRYMVDLESNVKVKYRDHTCFFMH